MLKGRQMLHENHHWLLPEIKLVNGCMLDNKRYGLTHDE